jgi:hypothetical protein
MEFVMIAPDVENDLINELARELADVTLTDIDDDNEDVLDMLYAEHEAMMYAANSYDLDAEAYGQM